MKQFPSVYLMKISFWQSSDLKYWLKNIEIEEKDLIVGIYNFELKIQLMKDVYYLTILLKYFSIPQFIKTTTLKQKLFDSHPK